MASIKETIEVVVMVGECTFGLSLIIFFPSLYFYRHACFCMLCEGRPFSS